MPRITRILAQSGIYHVTMRGNAKADIFESDEHRRRFLDLLIRYRDEYQFYILAWCLMDNHVHLILAMEDADMSEVLQRLATAYAVYYNNSEERVGHLFQSPFRSKPIEYEQQLINTVRYIHKNPERAQICNEDEYAWSSYAEYQLKPWITYTELVLGICGGADELLLGAVDDACVVRETRRPVTISDFEASRILKKELGISSCADVAAMPKGARNEIIRKAARLNLPIGQLARLFGLGERTVYRIVRDGAKSLERAMEPIKWQKGFSPF